MKNEEQSMKTFNVKMPVSLWKYLKIAATNEDMTMMDFVCRAVEEYKPEHEKRLMKNNS
jgi:hypothetical protein